MHMKKAVLLTTAVSLFAPACESGDFVDESGDTFAETGPFDEREQPGDVAAADPWLAEIDHSRIGAVDHGFVIAGYDKHSNEIGKISVYQIGSNLVEIKHEYPRPCDQSVPQGAEDCADILRVTAHVTGNVEDDWADVWQTATPGGHFTDRAHAILAKLPPDTAEGKLRCVLTVAASAAACVGVSVMPLLTGPACAYGAYESMCACREAFELAFPDLDWAEICD
jgi:hypothetical protein